MHRSPPRTIAAARDSFRQFHSTIRLSLFSCSESVPRPSAAKSRTAPRPTLKHFNVGGTNPFLFCTKFFRHVLMFVSRSVSLLLSDFVSLNNVAILYKDLSCMPRRNNIAVLFYLPLRVSLPFSSFKFVTLLLGSLSSFQSTWPSEGTTPSVFASKTSLPLHVAPPEVSLVRT